MKDDGNFGVRIGKQRVSFVIACSALALVLCACGDDKGKDNNNNNKIPDGQASLQIVDSVAKPLTLASKTGCRIDVDCADGLFCFQGVCTKECGGSHECAVGSCNDRGRCVKQSGNRMLRDRDTENVVAESIIPDAKIFVHPAAQIDVRTGEESVPTTIETVEDYGPILYRIESEGAAVGDANNAVAEEKTISGSEKKYIYTFDIPTNQSAMGERGKVEAISLISSVGTFNIDLLPHPETSGAYEGAVVASQFGGSSIPFRAAVEVTPKNPKNFDDIQSIKLYLPVSGNDIYSPETIEDGKTFWSWVNMTKTTNDRNCHTKGRNCWQATFGSNDYSIDGSVIISKDTKLYRSIRVEFSDYDAAAGRFEGFVNDGFKGIYREKSAADDSEIDWTEISVEGDLLMIRTSDDEWSDANKVVKPHSVETDITRSKEESPAPRCTGTDLQNIFASTACAVASLDDYNALSFEDKVKCTTDGANTLLSDETLTSKMITIFLESTEASQLVDKTGCSSFAEFLTACSEHKTCSAGTIIPCRERTDMVCAADLLSTLYFDRTAELDDSTNELNAGQATVYSEVVFKDILDLMRESYLGPQFAAYQHDIDIRQQWLENTDAPRILSSTLETFNSGLLNKWKQLVLDAHYGVIAKQFNQGVIEAISRSTDNDHIKSHRAAILSEYADAWMGASDALALATRRYDSLLTTTTERLTEASNIRPKLLDLYIVGAVESTLNIDNGVTSLNASFGTGINEITNGLKSLDQSFEDLIYMRDAEIAVSRSLNPESNNGNLLTRRQQAASDALDAADQKKTYVFDKIQQQKFDQASITAVLSNNVDSLKAEMASLCGLPAGCTDVTKCDVEVETFKCGFRVDKSNEDVPTDLTESDPNIGSAGAAILAFREAVQDINIAQADLNAQLTKVKEAQSVAAQFEETIEALNEDRNQNLAKITENLNKLQGLIDANKTAAISELEKELKAMQDDAKGAAESLNDWDKMVSASNSSQKSLMDDITRYNNQSLASEFSGDMLTGLADVAAEFLDFDAGDTPMATLQSFSLAAGRGGIKAAGYAGWLIANSVKLSVDQKANNAQNQLDQAAMDSDYEIEKWERQNEADDLAARAKVQAEITELEKTMAENSAEMETLKVLNELFQKEFDAKEQYAYDRAQLYQLSSQVATTLADVETKLAVVQKAELARDRKLLEYLTIAQNAQLLKTQYEAAQQRLLNVQNVYSTPASVFSFASDLEVVESNINLAKEKIYDYLALVEYYAVRPFVDLRRAIYLAKSPNDLRGILNKINELVETCGSTAQQNQPEITISLREFMGITRDYDDMTMAERFRAIINKGDLPVDALTRYTADSNVKQLLKQGNVLAGTFQIDKSTFNIGANCNAKLNTISVRIEGSDLAKSDAGAVYPSLTIFYNGSSTLTSCQPGMDDVVQPLGGRTKFGTYSSFSIPTELMTPNASLGKYVKLEAETKYEADDFREPNFSFDGLPIMTSYTVLIDPNMGDNKKINWDNIEDIKLRIKYSYDSLKSSKCF